MVSVICGWSNLLGQFDIMLDLNEARGDKMTMTGFSARHNHNKISRARCVGDVSHGMYLTGWLSWERKHYLL